MQSMFALQYELLGCCSIEFLAEFFPLNACDLTSRCLHRLWFQDDQIQIGSDTMSQCELKTALLMLYFIHIRINLLL